MGENLIANYSHLQLRAFRTMPAAPRTSSALAVLALHLAFVSGLLLVGPVRERIFDPRPLTVSLIETPRERHTQPPPPLTPHLREAPQVQVAPPVFTIAPEVTVTPAAPRPSITVAVAPPPAAPSVEPAAVTSPPRFDVAYLRNPPPVYPPASRRTREQGRVLLGVLVNAAGEAETVEVRTSSGSSRLDQAAMAAVKRWRFEPARRGGTALAAWALVPIDFQLET
jgi:protein TonB